MLEFADILFHLDNLVEERVILYKGNFKFSQADQCHQISLHFCLKNSSDFGVSFLIESKT
jgi:hypothetical protein